MLIKTLQSKINKVISQTFNIETDLPIEQHTLDLTIKPGFLLAKQLKQSPDQVCKSLIEPLLTLPEIESLETVSGYINMRLSPECFNSQLDYKPFATGRVKLDYASLNPTGPMHAGHLRNAILGDVLASVLEFAGYDTVREYYVNDTGGQAQKLVEAVYGYYLRALGHDADTGSQYQEEYVQAIAQRIAKEDGDKWMVSTGLAKQDQIGDRISGEPVNITAEPYYQYFRTYAVKILLQNIVQDLADLNIKHDTYQSEYELDVWSVLPRLEYEETILDDPIKHKIENPKPVLAYKGRALTKSDGTHTYLLGDIALHCKRFDDGFDWVINYFGADHAEHGKFLQSIMSGLYPNKKLSIKTNQMVNFERNGQVFKMSKRAGTYVTARDIMDMIGSDLVRINMLTRTSNSQLTVDIDQIMQIDETSPVFYMQYAHARCCSVLTKVYGNTDNAHITDVAGSSNIHLSPALRELYLKAHLFPSVLEQITNTLEVHSLYQYLLDLSKFFHSVWNSGARLSANPNLVLLVKDVLYNGLKILGLQAKTTMH